MAKRENQQQAQAERLKEILKGFGIRTQKDLDEALPKALDPFTACDMRQPLIIVKVRRVNVKHMERFSAKKYILFRRHYKSY